MDIQPCRCSSDTLSATCRDAAETWTFSHVALCLILSSTRSVREAKFVLGWAAKYWPSAALNGKNVGPCFFGELQYESSLDTNLKAMFRAVL
jgi:hypothetical protein